jgi:spore germination protein
VRNVLGVALLAAVLGLTGCGVRDAGVQPEGSSRQEKGDRYPGPPVPQEESLVRSKEERPAKMVLGYYEKRSQESVERFGGAYLKAMTTMTFNLNATGNGAIDGAPPREGMATAAAKGVQVFAALTNHRDGNFDRKLTHDVLNDPGKRARVVQSTVEIVRSHGYRGINVDFENMDPGDRALFTQFVRELAGTMRAGGFQTIVSVTAKASDAPTSAWAGAFDYKALGEAADYVQLMTYDEHGTWSAAGPVASLPWVEQVVRYATGQIPGEKLLLGLPAYAYDWNVTANRGHRAHTWKAVHKLLAETGAEPKWDEPAQSPYFQYQAQDGSRHTVWYENEESIARKTRLVQQYELAGVSVWRMGFEDERFWQAVRNGLES